MVEANNNIESVCQNLQENDERSSVSLTYDKIASLIESMKKLSIAINDTDTEVLGLEIDEISSRINDMIVIDLTRQVLYKEIRISLCELLLISDSGSNNDKNFTVNMIKAKEA
ncbi:hypothetical protein Glove_131g57 [Diversispora epigaea]|uniref:Uncharacterized protein n=1 Tax=Diversispora epigaea TaxID=1348612 RepID=A0A397J2F4_9GLOM|nr:hypothetical protein Glove_131g57 [Diversispora epigaea]